MHNIKKNIFPIFLIIIFLVAPIFIKTSFFLSLIITICIFSILAISYDLLLGYTGIVSFGHAIYFGLGAYIVALTSVKLHWPFILGLVIALISCIFISFILGIITIRVKTIYFNMITLALGELVYVLALKLYKFTGGDDGLPGVRSLFSDRLIFYYFMIFTLLLIFLLVRKIVNSPAGSVLKAIGSNEHRAIMLGYDVFKFKLLSLQISGLLAGFAGAIYVAHVGIAYPTLLSVSITLEALFMVVLGGVGTLTGPIIGAVIMRLSNYVLSKFTNRWMLILGFVFVIVVIFFPKGLMGMIHKVMNSKRTHKK